MSYVSVLICHDSGVHKLDQIDPNNWKRLASVIAVKS